MLRTLPVVKILNARPKHLLLRQNCTLNLCAKPSEPRLDMRRSKDVWWHNRDVTWWPKSKPDNLSEICRSNRFVRAHIIHYAAQNFAYNQSTKHAPSTRNTLTSGFRAMPSTGGGTCPPAPSPAGQKSRKSSSRTFGRSLSGACARMSCVKSRVGASARALHFRTPRSKAAQTLGPTRSRKGERDSAAYRCAARCPNALQAVRRVYKPNLPTAGGTWRNRSTSGATRHARRLGSSMTSSKPMPSR